MFIGKVFCASDTILGLANSALTAYTVRIFAKRVCGRLDFLIVTSELDLQYLKINGVVLLFQSYMIVLLILKVL